MRSKLHYLATFVLVSIACVNIWAFNQYVSRFPPKEADERVIWEQRLAAIQSVLISAGYRNGDVGYLPAGALKGQTTAREEVDWVHVRYTMIPLNVLYNTVEAPFVVAQFTGEVAGFTKLYDPGNGWALYQRKSSQ